ncbi:MAG: cytidylate kinase [Paracoccaceae bacterium]|jgi:cytidylate kinase
MTDAPVRFTVAIDGPAAAGKGTLSRAVAARYGFVHLDTGLLYRATGMKARTAAGPDFTDRDAAYAARSLTALDLKADGLRTGAAGESASRVAAIPAVRDALLDFQRDFARRPGGAVLDGRDIGTVICPEAEVKLFVTAKDHTRAARRHAELTKAGEPVTIEDVLANLRRRDARDAARDQAPLAAARDALLLDTTDLSIDAAIAKAVALIDERRAL